MTLTDKLVEIGDLLNDGKTEQLQASIEELHAADIAEMLAHINKSDDRKTIFNLIDPSRRGEVLVEAELPIREELLSEMDTIEKSDVINQLNTDDATDIFIDIDESEREEVLEHVDTEVKEEVLELMTYDEDSAGGLMRKEFVAVHESMTTNEVIEVIRNTRDTGEDVFNVWVVDHRNHLLGRIRLRDLVLSKPNLPASDIMVEEYYWVDVNMEQEDVARIFEKYDLVEIPVVNEKHQLVGHITVDDIVDVIEEEAQEDISKLAGTGAEEIKEISILKIVRARLPWLIVALFAGLGSAYIMLLYDEMLKQFYQLAFFVPVVIAMGGNVGIQSSTIVIRGMATGEIDMYDIGYRLTKELNVAVLNGFLIALILFGLVVLVFGDVTLAIVTTSALIVAVLCAGFVGALVPFLLKKLNIDPALSSGPFITTSNDIIGTFIYFVVAKLIMV